MTRRRWLLISLVLTLLLTCSLAAVALAGSGVEPAVETTIAANSTYVLDGTTVIDRRAAGATAFESTHTPGSSAIYAKEGATASFLKPLIKGNGFLTDADLTNELASKYGYASAVLVYGSGSRVNLVDPTITTATDSNANGGFATCGGKLNIIGGTITTNNRLGHGLDATYGGVITATGTTIHTSGANSGALATDFGGGFITVYNVDATAEVAGSPGIYTAGMSVIKAYNSTFTSHGCEAVMIAHDSGHTYLTNCTLTGTVGLNGHNSMTPLYSYLVMRGGTLNSTSGALITEMGGKSDMTLIGVKLGTMGNGKLIEPQSGRLIVRLQDMAAKGDVVRAAKSYLEVSLADTDLSAAVTATKLSVDADSSWLVTGNSSVVDLTLANSGVIRGAKGFVVTFNTLTVGGVSITSDTTIGGVKFIRSTALVDDYEEAGPPPPPPGTGGGAGAPPGGAGAPPEGTPPPTP